MKYPHCNKDIGIFSKNMNAMKQQICPHCE